MVWGLGILNAEHTDYSTIFVNLGGIEIVLEISNNYSIIIGDPDDELDSVVTYALTSSCYENERDYALLKPMMSYLQDVLMRTEMLDNDNITDSIMGLESIIMNGGSEAIKDFMSYHNIESFLKKLIDFYHENIRVLMVIDLRNEEDEYIHMTYPAINMIGSLLYNVLDESNEETAEKFYQLGMISCLQEAVHVMVKVKENFYWAEAFKQIILLVSAFIASGNNSADKIMRGTMLVDHLFETIIFKKNMHEHVIGRDIMFEFMTLLQNLARMEDDFCMDKILDIGII
jgi:hypothetical protein